MIEKFGPYIGGEFFPTSAIFGTLTTQLISIYWFAKAYEALAREGKLKDLKPDSISEEEWERLLEVFGGQTGLIEHLKKFEKIIQDGEELSEKFKEFFVFRLKEMGISEEEIQKIISILDTKEIIEHFKEIEKAINPSFVEKLKVGFSEAIVKNPARKAIFLGILTSLTLTPIFSPFALKLPFLWAVLGDLEVFSSGIFANIFGGKGSADRLLRKLAEGKYRQ